MNTEATILQICDLHPDKVIIAAGAKPVRLPVDGAESAFFAQDVLDGSIPVPEEKKVVIIGGGTVGCETALYLHSYKNKLSIVEATDVLAKGQQSTHRVRDLTLLEEYGIDRYLLCSVMKITPEGVWCRQKDGTEILLEADVVLLACGQRGQGEDLYESLWDLGIPAVKAGSCAGTLNIRTSVAMGFAAGYEA